MTELVDRVQCNIKITLSDGTEIDINNNISNQSNSNAKNFITDISLDEKLNAQNNNPVGVVSSNTLKISLNSNDRSLFPDNEKSPYYGKMDNSARVYLTMIENDETISFNTFYVSNWTTSITSSTPYRVIIECTDLLSIICKNNIENIIITDNLSTSEALIYMLDRYNASIEDKYKVHYRPSDIKFDNFNNIVLDNIDSENIGSWFNILSQSTLTNLYIDRDDLFKTDNCLDDKASESVCTLSDKINITQASVDSGGLVRYNGVKTNYIVNSLNGISEIINMNGQSLKGGSNKINDINFSQRVYKVTGIGLNVHNSIPVDITNFTYNQRRANLELYNNSGDDVNVDIIINGQTFMENTLSITKLNDSSSNEILEVTNKLLSADDVEVFTSNLLKLCSLRNSSLSVTGFINPRIKLGDTVYVDLESSIQTKGYYKVVGISMRINNVIKTTLKLIKIILDEEA